ncbi:UNVERIFIED_CONTAM: hypothetical protein K2H54_026379 [Gekko kuhli]
MLICIGSVSPRYTCANIVLVDLGILEEIGQLADPELSALDGRMKHIPHSILSSHQESPFVPFPKETKEVSHHEKSNSSIERESLTAVNNSLQSNSIPSIPDERDSTSVATEYSLKFDSMTEDEMEEKSFRSLLPSESHRRISLKKRSHRGYSDQEAASRKMPLSSVKASIQYFVSSYVWDSSG